MAQACSSVGKGHAADMAGKCVLAEGEQHAPGPPQAENRVMRLRIELEGRHLVAAVVKSQVFANAGRDGRVHQDALIRLFLTELEVRHCFCCGKPA